MRDAINEGYKTAMKAGDKRRTATLRSINAAIKNLDIEARGQGKPAPGEPEILVMVQKMVKQREESLAMFTAAKRNDLATIEREEIAILSEFLPRGLSDAEVDAAIKAAVASTAAAGAKDMGKVIAALKAEYPGRIDFSKASAKVKAALG